MINRRTFLTTSAAFSARVAGFPRALLNASAGDTIITILHTNDTHSQIDPLPANDANAGKGGVARRATVVKRVRKENPNTLLVDAGDVMQGTPYFNFYRGEVEYKAMSAIGYDVGTLGNHEFDNGVEVCELRSGVGELRSQRDRARRTRETVRREDCWRDQSGIVWFGDQSGRAD